VTDLVVVGDIMLDVGVHAPLLAAGGDVHGRVRVGPGGSAANAAVWAAAAGARVLLHGRVGDDAAGRVVADALADRGVEATLAIDRSEPTGTMLVVWEAGERSMVADPGANTRLSPEDLPEAIEAGAVLVSGYAVLHEGSLPAARAALARARAEHVAVDAASWPLLEAFGGEPFLRAADGATVLFANQREAEVLTGSEEAEKAARTLGRRFPMACVKLGARGAVLAAGDRLLRATPRHVQEVDPIGAGDAFDGTFLASLALGAGLEESLRRACDAGAEAAATAGPWPAR
jgi:sugar/nucleoside kinase (ribokinase family)